MLPAAAADPGAPGPPRARHVLRRPPRRAARPGLRPALGADQHPRAARKPPPARPARGAGRAHRPPPRPARRGPARAARPRPGLGAVPTRTPTRLPALRRPPPRRPGHPAAAPPPLRLPAAPALDRATRHRRGAHPADRTARDRPGATPAPAAAAPPRLGRHLRRGPDRVPDLRTPVEPARRVHRRHLSTLAATHRRPHRGRSADFTASRVFAAVYPEAVTLAAVLAPHVGAASPTATTSNADSSSPRSAGASAVPLPARRHQRRHRALDELGCPSTADQAAADLPRYPNQRLQPRVHPGKGNQARHERSSFWFARRPDGGNVILHHRHVRPVLIRPWSPTMERIDGAIWASTLLDPAPPRSPRKSPHRTEQRVTGPSRRRWRTAGRGPASPTFARTGKIWRREHGGAWWVWLGRSWSGL